MSEINLKSFKNLKDWYTKEIKEYQDDIREGGCVGGVSGITHYSETIAIYDHFADDIWEVLVDRATDQGLSPLNLIASFTGSNSIITDYAFKNMLVWFVVEDFAFNNDNDDNDDFDDFDDFIVDSLISLS